ncbi:MAG: hypothetical protein KC766_30780 [Myxococcales bacterium]|nr:hypothetical protein [Myxococcales bacterium]
MRAEWEKRIAQEACSQQADASLLKKPLPGVLPYSSRRSVLKRWPTLDDQLGRLVVSKGYRDAVEASLAKRETSRTASEHIIGFATHCRERAPSLSERGAESFRQLRSSAGQDHVHLRAARARREESDRVTLERVEFAVR